MNIALWRKNDRAPLPVGLPDQATSFVGAVDARRAQALSELRDLENRLSADLDQTMKALAVVRDAITREEAAEIATQAIAEANEAVARVIEEYNPGEQDASPKPVSRPSKSKKTEVVE